LALIVPSTLVAMIAGGPLVDRNPDLKEHDQISTPMQ
jgi:hypothetical protein